MFEPAYQLHWHQTYFHPLKVFPFLLPSLLGVMPAFLLDLDLYSPLVEHGFLIFNRILAKLPSLDKVVVLGRVDCSIAFYYNLKNVATNPKRTN